MLIHRLKKFKNSNIELNPSYVTPVPGLVNKGKTGSTVDQGDPGSSTTGSNTNNVAGSPMYCYICCKKGHIAAYCHSYACGPNMRTRLQELGRCDACLILENVHDTTCRTENVECAKCKGFGHMAITCNGEKHPGSWILKSCVSGRKPTAATQ